MIEKQLIALVNKFKDRLDNTLIADLIVYIDHNEMGLTLDILCDWLSEGDVAIAADEYDEIAVLWEYFKFDMNDPSLAYLKNLISD